MKLAQRRALAELSLIVDVVSQTPNRERDSMWWAQIRRLICERHGISTMFLSPGHMVDDRGLPMVLSPRGAEALAMAAQGHTVPSAARELGLSENTVKTHRQRAKQALGASTTAQAVAIAMRLGIIEGNQKDESEQDVGRSAGAGAGRAGGGTDGERERELEGWP
jgi:DNA-binding CsgD family transcriptional regulator